MSFKEMVGNREIHYISMLISCFGIVEAEQMRRLFDYLSSAQYGSIMSRLRRDGMFCTSSDALLLAQNSHAFKALNPDERVMAFEVFIVLRDRITDFSAGDPPAIAALASNENDFALIPVLPERIDLINVSAGRIPDETRRLLVTRDLDLVAGIDRRYKNDYVFHIAPDKKVETYEL